MYFMNLIKMTCTRLYLYVLKNFERKIHNMFHYENSNIPLSCFAFSLLLSHKLWDLSPFVNRLLFYVYNLRKIGDWLPASLEYIKFGSLWLTALKLNLHKFKNIFFKKYFNVFLRFLNYYLSNIKNYYGDNYWYWRRYSTKMSIVA